MAAQIPPVPAQPAQPAQPAMPAPPAPRARAMAHTYVRTSSGSGGYLGVSVSDISQDQVASLKLPDDSGVEVNVVDQDGPAGKAGLREHDVIRSFNGQKVESRAQLFRMLTETPAGHTVSLEILRSGQPLNIKVQLADRHTVSTFVMPHDFPDVVVPSMNIDIPNMTMVMSVGRSGVQVESLSPQLREFFGVPSEQGVLVRSVERGSAAEQAGIRAGDVIVKVQDRQVRNTSDFRMALRDSSGKSVSVGLVRDKREQAVTLKLPERRDSSSARDYEIDLSGLDEGMAGLQANLAQLEAQKEQWKEWQKQWQKSAEDSRKQWEKWQKDWEKQWKDQQKQWQDEY